MAASNYDAALARVLTHEGGYSNHPSDPGGPTNFGITLANYARFKGRSVSAAEVRAMPLADAMAIYKASYWDALRCDELPAGLDYAVFDYGVNSGVSRAARVMQRLLGQTATGTMTDALVAAARAAAASGLIARLCDERLAFLKGLKTWPVFGAGWGRRVAEVRRDALAMAKSVSVAPATSAAAGGKASVPEPKVARTTTAATVVVAGAGAAQVAHASGASWSIVVALVVVGMAAGVAAWIGWTVWHKRKQGRGHTCTEGDIMTWLSEKLKGWRTMIFGVVVTLAGVTLDLLDALRVVDITPLLPPEHALKIIAAIGVVTVLLRLITTGRVGQKEG